MLQQNLGETYEIIEEGLGSRTTDVDFNKKPGRNGLTYFKPCLDTHFPLDYIVIALGTNDLKIQYDRPVSRVSKGVEALITTVKSFAYKTDSGDIKIVIVSPALINPKAKNFSLLFTDYYDEKSAAKSKQLGTSIKQVAENYHCDFLNTTDFAETGDDGIHWTADTHSKTAKLLAEIIKK